MKLHCPQDHRIAVFEELEPFYLELLRQLPASADPGESAPALARLFSGPMQVDSAGFNADWRELVEPELREMFRSAREIVLADLAELPPLDPGLDPACGSLESAVFTPAGHSLEIPRSHAEAWLGVLNQARLVTAAKRDFGDREMDEDLEFPPASQRDLDLFRIDFYGLMQQVLMRELGF